MRSQPEIATLISFKSVYLLKRASLKERLAFNSNSLKFRRTLESPAQMSLQLLIHPYNTFRASLTWRWTSKVPSDKPTCKYKSKYNQWSSKFCQTLKDQPKISHYATRNSTIHKSKKTINAWSNRLYIWPSLLHSKKDLSRLKNCCLKLTYSANRCRCYR